MILDQDFADQTDPGFGTFRDRQGVESLDDAADIGGKILPAAFEQILAALGRPAFIKGLRRTGNSLIRAHPEQHPHQQVAIEDAENHAFQQRQRNGNLRLGLTAESQNGNLRQTCVQQSFAQ